MKIESFFENFELLTDAPNAVAKLREIILGIAYSGKLTARWRSANSNDESGSTLLKQIKSERSHWIQKESKQGNSEAKILANKLTKHSPLFPNEYQIPENWAWASLLQACWSVVDCHNKTATYISQGIPLVRTSDIRDGKLSLNNVKFISQETYEFWSRRCPPEPGDILFTREAPMGEAAIIPEKAKICMGQRMMLLRPFHHLFLKEYLLFALIEPSFQKRMVKSAVGMTVKHLRVGDVESLIIPVPPLTEQKRIVEKCDRLLSTCDEIEKRQQQRQQSILRMNESAIAQLLSSQNPEEFRQHWQRICNNFDLLYSVPETIPKLRQVILLLAVQGKLVRQDPNDEPASFLFKQIKAEKQRISRKVKSEREKSSTMVEDDEYFFDLPKGWAYTRLEEICFFFSGYAFKSSSYVQSSNHQIIRLGNVKNDQIILEQNPAFIPNEIALENEKFLIANGDILITMTGTKNKKDFCFTAIAEDKHFANTKLYLNQRVGCIRVIRPILPRLINIFMKSPMLVDFLLSSATGTANQANIGTSTLLNLPFPLPPLAEQKRIVEKCDRLMSLCDTLEAKLKQGRDSSEKLMEVAAKQLLTA